ncbi:hypothetical protein PHISP_00072, partial [Aspergillus sp. HF37]
MNDSGRGDLYSRPGDPHFDHARSMHIPTSSEATIPEPRQWDYRGVHLSQTLSLRKDSHGAVVPVENGSGGFDLSQSSDGSKYSPSALGSGSQTSLMTAEGSQPSSLGNGQGLPQPFLGNGTKMDLGSGGQADAVSASHLQSPSKVGSRHRVDSLSGQKRTAAGDIKASPEAVHPHESGINAVRRNRSKTIGSPSRGNRIAELSAHLRSRLSYAAAKVEKDWQRDGPQVPLRLRQSASPTPTALTMKSDWPKSYHLQNRISESTNTSASSLSEVSHSNPSNDPVQMSPAGRSDHTSYQPLAAGSPTKPLQTPKLAPPVNIIASGSGGRRRPNPNESGNSRYAPYPGHRRYHSQQEFGTSKLPASSNMTLAPETPPLRPSIHTASPSTHGHSRARTHSHSTLMEQDAIETLMFMSSPENSGYRPSQKPQQHAIPKSIAPATSDSSTWSQNQSQQLQVNGGNGAPNPGFTSQSPGTEARAGDEIDRMLDQMEDSDSDSDDGRAPSNHVGTGSQP